MSTLIVLTERNANHIIASNCYLPVSYRSLVNRCGSLGICKPQIFKNISNNASNLYDSDIATALHRNSFTSFYTNTCLVMHLDIGQGEDQADETWNKTTQFQFIWNPSYASTNLSVISNHKMVLPSRLWNSNVMEFLFRKCKHQSSF